MRKLLTALGALWRASLSTMLQYRGEIALWAIWGIVYPAVALAMWTAAMQSTPGRTNIKGFGPGEFAAYFLMTMVVGHVCTAWDVYEMGYLVRTGKLSPALLRPILPMWSSLMDNVAYKVVTLAILLPIWVGVAWVTNPRFETTWGHALIGIVALLMAGVINYLWSYNLAMLAFWTTRTDAAGECWFGGSLLFGGRLAPLALLPGPMGWLAAVLPFKWVIWYPTTVLTGHMPLGSAAWGLLCQVGWLGAGLLVFRFLWRAGLKRYSAVGT